MDNAQRSTWAWVILLGLAALILPALAGYVVFEQSRTPLLGIYVDDADPPAIVQVVAGSAAEAAGLRRGDTILAVDGSPYAAWDPAGRRLGQAYTFDVIRQGEPQTLPAVMGSMLQANRAAAFSAILVALVFWGVGLLLLRRGFSRMHVRLLFLFYQTCAVALLTGLAYPRFWLPQPWMVSLAVAALVLAGPLFLHYQLSFPVVLGAPRRRVAALVLLYGLALVGAADAWRRSIPWTSPAVFAALLTGFVALGVATTVYLRRASADDRRRIRVAFAGTLVGLAPPMVAYVIPTAVMGYSPAIPRWAVSLSLAIMPLSYLYATGRHDLFGIDRLLNRATVYGALSAGIFALYLALMFLLYRLVPDDWMLRLVAITGLTLITAFTFQPARSRVQHWVDLLFYAGWYDYPSVVERVSARLALSQDWETVSAILAREVPRQMHLHGARLAVGERSVSTLEPDVQPALDIALACGGQACGEWAVGPRRDGDGLNLEDRRILQTLARQAEVSLSNVLLLEALRGQLDEVRASRGALMQLQHQLLRSREAERGRLARDLHDGPIQALVGMNMQLSMLLSSVGLTGDTASIGPTLQEMRAEVLDLLGELRQVCTELRPPMLDTMGLGAALRALAEEWSAHNGVAVQCDLPPDATLRALPGEVAVNLYRVVQEALSNVAHHAQARLVDLRLAWDEENGRLDLTLQDDGRGFTPAAIEDLTSQGHFGLAGIRERVALIGGAWRLDTAPGQGTTLHVVWPADRAGQLP